MPEPTPPAEPLFERAWRFVRALIVGSAATLADVSVLTVLIRFFHLAPSPARLPALLVGAHVQFFGNRTFTFRAQRGRLSRQAKLFVFLEALALLANWAVFSYIAPRVKTLLAPEIASFIGTFIVFVGFSYPVRRLVIFKLTPAEAAQTDAPDRDEVAADEA